MSKKDRKQNPLGKSLIKSRFNPKNNSEKHTTQESTTSITQQSDLDQFLANATLANTDFTARKTNNNPLTLEKININIVPLTYENPFLLNQNELGPLLEKHASLNHKLVIPRRPAWDKTTTAEQLHALEKTAFLEWRRSLVTLEEYDSLLLTPYERNIEVWRQLWRVVERSDIIVQIVDARNPLLFHSADLDNYVNELSSLKINLLLVNKADLLSTYQRAVWAEYFTRHGISFVFFSAAIAQYHLDKENEMKVDEEIKSDDIESPKEEEEEMKVSIELNTKSILSVHDLIHLFNQLSSHQTSTVGFVGYPNVGKSSTINALLGAKKVNVSSTPGKTKHFQTLILTPTLTLCDCPGLVFPSFSTTKADMVLSGVLPIDQLREYTAPIQLLLQKVSRSILELIYGIQIKTLDPMGDVEDRLPVYSEFLRPYAISRGYTKASQGNPDEHRASRYVLKDFVNGKLLYVSAPPKCPTSILIPFHNESESHMRLQKKRLRNIPVQKSLFKSVKEQEDVNARSKGNDEREGKELFVRVEMPMNILTKDLKSGGKEMKEIGDKKHFKVKKGKTRDYWTRDYNY